MKITELVKLLVEMHEKHGDAEVFDTVGNPVIGVTDDDLETMQGPDPKVYIESEF